MEEQHFYQPSGKSPLVGFFIALGLGSIAAIFLSFIYNSLTVLIPIIYVNLFICIGFGIALGFLARYLARLGKIRNKQQNVVLATMLGFVGWYFQWIAYFVFLESGEHSFQSFIDNLSLFYNPGEFIQLLLYLNEIGAWQMFGVTFTDFALWAVWSMELLIIIGIPIVLAIKHAIIPFSEKLNKWYRKVRLKDQFESISTIYQFKNAVFENPEKAIYELTYGQPFRYSEISIFYLDGEEDHFLSVDNVYIERDNKKKSYSSIIRFLKIDTDTAANLMKKYGVQKQFALTY